MALQEHSLLASDLSTKIKHKHIHISLSNTQFAVTVNTDPEILTNKPPSKQKFI
jgi:hypothetical protein